MVPINAAITGIHQAAIDTFFNWYNYEHHHSGLALLTPDEVHYQRAEEVLRNRQGVLQAAYKKNPQRFVKGAPILDQLPTAVWINPPKPSIKIDEQVLINS